MPNIHNQLDIIERIDELIAQSESDVDKLMAKRLQEILNTLNTMYTKFVVKDETSYTDLNKYNRLSKELERIAEQLNQDYKAIVKMIEVSNERIYVEEILMTAYLFEVYQSTEMGFNLPTSETIAATLTNPVEFLTLPKVFEQHRNELIRKLNIEISSSLMQGEGYWKMASRIEKTFGFSQNKARTVARTEGGRARSIANEEVTAIINKHADTSKKWLSTLDDRTRHTHRKLDGQVAKDGYFHFKAMKSKGPHLWGVASMDINCRCVTMLIVNGQIPELRRGRDYRDSEYQSKLAKRIDSYMEDGYTYAQAYKKARKEVMPPNAVVDYVTYEDWAEKYGEVG